MADTFSLPKSVTLENDEVHVWLAVLSPTPSQLRSFKEFLSSDERKRAERYRFQRDRDLFIARRGLLRKILGRYLGIESADVQFCYNPYGKPALTGGLENTGLRFNLSHSHGLALYAITRNRRLGVDLERINPDKMIDQIAGRFFSDSEVQALRSLPEKIQLEAFFSCWTRKEAYIKAKGAGLSMALDQFVVSLAPGEPAALLSTNDDRQEYSRWSLEALHPKSGYAAALCVEGHGCRMTCYGIAEDHSDQSMIKADSVWQPIPRSTC